jgi:hypothetical protein
VVYQPPFFFFTFFLFIYPTFHHFLIFLQANHCLSKYSRIKDLQSAHDLQKEIHTEKAFSKIIFESFRGLNCLKENLGEVPLEVADYWGLNESPGQGRPLFSISG